MLNTHSISKFICASFLLPVALQSHAQESSLILEEVVVTAQKRAESLLDVSVSVSAFTEEGLANSGVQKFEDLAKLTPSLSLQDNLSPFQKSVYIRGVGTTIFSATVESSVSTVLDGVVLARQGQFFSDLADIERVEILRGPQSTLFGKNASAGVVSIVTRLPSTEASEGNVGLAYDEYGELRLKGTYSAPINEQFAYRLSANFNHIEESHIENVNSDGPTMDGAESWGLRGKLLWSISPDLSALLVADYSDSDSPGGARVLRSVRPGLEAATFAGGSREFVVGEENRTVNINDDNNNQVADWGLSTELNWSLENHTVTSISAFRSWDLDVAVDIDSTGVDIPLSSYPGVGTPSFRGTVTTNRETSQWSQELRIQSDHSGDLQYVVGAYLWGTSYESDGDQRRSVCFDISRSRPVYSSCEGAIPPGTVLGSQSFRELIEVETEYYALFGQADYQLRDNLTLTLGLRIQKDDFEWDVEQLGPIELGDLAEQRYQGTGSVSYTETTGKAVIKYSFNESSNGYFSISRGYKGPGAFFSSDFTEPLAPEFVNAYELGYKARLLDGRLSLNSALFWQEFEDTQVSFFDDVESVFRPTNAGETRQRGLELDVKFAASTNLILSTGLTWLDGEFLDFSTACFTNDPNPQCAVDGSKDLSGERTTFSPKWKFVSSGRFYTPLIAGSMDGFVQLSYRWQSEEQYGADHNPLTEQDAYGVLDLSFGMEAQDDSYSLTIFVHNLLDESYTSNIGAFPDATGESDLAIQFVPKSADRYFGASIKYQF